MSVEAARQFLVSHNIETPVMFFDENEAQKTVSLISEHLKKADIYYAVKSCYNTNLLKFFASCGLGAEVMSELEFDLAKTAKFKRIILNGLGRSEQCIMKALQHKNTTIIVASKRDLHIVKRYLAEHQRQKCRLGIRLRFDLQGADGSKNLYLEPLNKLGNYIDSDFYQEFMEYVCHQKRALWDLVHMHFTINELNPSTYVNAMKFLQKHLTDIEQRFHIMPQRIDLGGGIEVFSQDQEQKFQTLFLTLADQFSTMFPDQKLVLEPGRFLSASSGYVIGKIVDIKQVKNKKWLITNIGTNVLIPNKNARYKLVYPQPSADGEYIGITDGITSGSNNIVNEAYLNVDVHIGDDIIIGNAGAYTDVYSTFWGYAPFTIGYIFKSGKIKITRSAETIHQMYNLFFQINAR